MGSRASAQSIRSRIARFDWKEIARDLDRDGYARLPALLESNECDDLIALYEERERFRSFIDMRARRYGEGDYRYFAYPLPPLVRSLRSWLYPRLAAIANAWCDALGGDERFPTRLADFVEHCHEAGQTRPTPLLLRYSEGGFNCIHQDVYGAVAFPLQVACLLSPGPRDSRPAFDGGEFVLHEHRPRQQSRVEAITLSRGEGLVFPNRSRPIRGQRGVYRAAIKHGVSTIHSGERFTLGLIFHDAE